MTFQEHHTSSCSQVPHSAVPVETTGDCKGTVLLKGHVVDGLGVTLLMQYLFTCNQVKQTPGVVETTGRERGAMVGRDVNCFQNDSIVFWFYLILRPYQPSSVYICHWDESTITTHSPHTNQAVAIYLPLGWKDNLDTLCPLCDCTVASGSLLPMLQRHTEPSWAHEAMAKPSLSEKSVWGWNLMQPAFTECPGQVWGVGFIMGLWGGGKVNS